MEFVRVREVELAVVRGQWPRRDDSLDRHRSQRSASNSKIPMHMECFYETLTPSGTTSPAITALPLTSRRGSQDGTTGKTRFDSLRQANIQDSLLTETSVISVASENEDRTSETTFS